MKEKEVLLEKIRALVKDRLTLFEPHPSIKDMDMVFLPLSNYKEVMDLVLYLLKTCIMSLRSEYPGDSYFGEPELCVSEVLKLVTQLLPYEEMEFMGDIRTMTK